MFFDCRKLDRKIGKWETFPKGLLLMGGKLLYLVFDMCVGIDINFSFSIYFIAMATAD